MKPYDLNPGNFSDDKQENLRIENEILKLKMQAESGATFGSIEVIPPEIEYQFLQQVQEFEKAWQRGGYIKVHDFIGNPEFKKAEQLNSEELKIELERLTRLMQKKNVHLHVLQEYNPLVIYKFIIEELFEHEMDNILLPGWTTNFIYEEFHPGD